MFVGATVLSAMARHGLEEMLSYQQQMNVITAAALPIQTGQTLLSGMPVPSPVSHAKQQADAKIAELQAKLAALEAIVTALQPVEPAPHNPLINALSTWPGRGGVDQWSGMPLSVGRWVK